MELRASRHAGDAEALLARGCASLRGEDTVSPVLAAIASTTETIVTRVSQAHLPTKGTALDLYNGKKKRKKKGSPKNRTKTTIAA